MVPMDYSLMIIILITLSVCDSNFPLCSYSSFSSGSRKQFVGTLYPNSSEVPLMFSIIASTVHVMDARWLNKSIGLFIFSPQYSSENKALLVSLLTYPLTTWVHSNSCFSTSVLTYSHLWCPSTIFFKMWIFICIFHLCVCMYTMVWLVPLEVRRRTAPSDPLELEP